MAEEQELKLDDEGGKSNKMIIIIAVVAFLVIGGGAAFFFLGGDDPAPAEGDDVAEPVVVKEPASYVGVPGAITAQIKGEKKDRMVQIKLSFLVRGNEAENGVKKHMPRLIDQINIVVASAIADEIITPEGRAKLQEECLKVVQQVMQEIEGKPFVEKVLFVSFVMQ